MKPYLTVSADVLIVGGGSAGVMASEADGSKTESCRV